MRRNWGHSPAFRRRRGWRVLAWLAVPAIALLLARIEPWPPDLRSRAEAADGDSLVLQDTRVRLLGIDAPELDQLCWDATGAAWPCGRAAQQRLAGLVAAAETVCRPTGRDRYRRLLARCRVGGKDLARIMVAEGLALARPDYGEEQSAARRARLGIWDGRFADPAHWREDGPSGDPGPSLWEDILNWAKVLTGASSLR